MYKKTNSKFQAIVQYKFKLCNRYLNIAKLIVNRLIQY